MKSEAHKKFIRQLPCCICGDNTSTEAAHIRMSDSRSAKVNPGIGKKPSDIWLVPLCGLHHRLQHSVAEHAFWFDEGIDPIRLSSLLWGASGDIERGAQIVRCAGVS